MKLEGILSEMTYQSLLLAIRKNNLNEKYLKIFYFLIVVQYNMEGKVWNLRQIFIRIPGCFKLAFHLHIQLFLDKAIEYVNNASH